jgi:acyl-coenzyme A synthetase/AMP-(fatty) acid ligase
VSRTVLSVLTQAPGTGVALTAPDRADLTYDALRDVVAGVRRQLAARGTGPGDRVAIVLPNGPEMAVAFLAEYEFYL